MVATEELTGVIVTIHGFTLDSSAAQKRVELFDTEHEKCPNYDDVDHECYEHSQRITIWSIYKLEDEVFEV